MIHVTNSHLDLHMRTVSRGRWSAVSQVALKFDSDILEVFQNGDILVNGAPKSASISFLLDGIYPVEIAETRTTILLSGAQSIVFTASSSYGVTILMDAHGSDFFESAGMAGTWNKFGFNDRNGLPLEVTSTRNAVEYAIEWEVNVTRGDPLLFSSPAEHNCVDLPNNEPSEPTPEELEGANTVCNAVVLDPDEKENCIFDVLTAGVESVEDNIAYTEPFQSTERCIAAPKQENVEFLDAPPTCDELGGTCVFRCDASVSDCLQGPLCIENVDLMVVDERRRSRRRMQFIEGCSCRLPKQPSDAPSISSEPSLEPSSFPSTSALPSSMPTKSGKKSKSRRKRIR